MEDPALKKGEPAAHSASNRAFGLVMAVFLGLVGAIPMVRHHPIRRWALAAALASGAAALLFPAVLAWPNRWWSRLGTAMHCVVSPFILLIAYVIVVLPTATALRLLGRDPLCRRLEPSAQSYWIPRDPRPPGGSGMKDQF